MMENKVLVKLILPELDTSFDVFIPVNEITWKVKKLLAKAVSDLCNVHTYQNLDFILLNKDNSKIYDNNTIIIDSDIRNGTELLLISKL